MKRNIDQNDRARGRRVILPAAAIVREVGFNPVRTYDLPYGGKLKFEDTLMYRHPQAPGIKYVIAKIERGIWG